MPTLPWFSKKPDACDDLEACPFTIQVYYLDNGSHQCDAAVFNCNVNGESMGQVNLNNGDDGGSRYGPVWNYAQPPQQVTCGTGVCKDCEEQFPDCKNLKCGWLLTLECALDYCHEGIALVDVKNVDGQVVFSGSFSDEICLPYDEICGTDAP